MSIITNVEDLIFYKTNKKYQELIDKLETLDLKLKELELDKLGLEKTKLEIEMALYHLEREIASSIVRKP
jgi:hypothetical protein